MLKHLTQSKKDKKNYPLRKPICRRNLRKYNFFARVNLFPASKHPHVRVPLDRVKLTDKATKEKRQRLKKSFHFSFNFKFLLTITLSSKCTTKGIFLKIVNVLISDADIIVSFLSSKNITRLYSLSFFFKETTVYLIPVSLNNERFRTIVVDFPADFFETFSGFAK